MEANVTVDHVVDSWATLLKEYASNSYSYDEQQGMATVLQTLETMTAVGSINTIHGRNTAARIHVMCWIMIGSGRSHSLTASQVMEPSPHEQLASLRTIPSSSSSAAGGSGSWQFDVSYLDSGHVPSPLKDIHTVPPSLCTDTDDTTDNRAAKRLPFMSTSTRPLVQSIFTNLANLTAQPNTSTRPDTDTDTDTNTDTDNEQFTMLCIEFARVWSEMPISPETDSLVAHGVLAFLTGPLEPQGTRTGDKVNTRRTGGGRNNHNMTSAALAALLPIALQLCDRYTVFDQGLGLVLLWEVLVQRSTSSLLAAVGSWLLPVLHKVFLATPASFVNSDTTAADASHYSTNAVIVVASRVLQAVIVTNQSSPIGSHHAHLLLQRVEYKVTMTLDPAVAWPMLLALQPFVAHCPTGVLCCHLQSTVDMLLAMVNRWHTPLQVPCVQLLHLLVDRCQSAPLCVLPVIPKIIVELFRVEVFLQAGSSDITGVTVSDPTGPVVGALRKALRALATTLRQRYRATWEDTLMDVGLVPTDHKDKGDQHTQHTKADKEWRQTLVQCADRLLVGEI